MKAVHLATAVLLLFAGNFLSAQTLVERLYVMRVETTIFDHFTGMTHTCVLLYPDGRYRMERSYQSSQDKSSETKVYQDTLPDPDFKALQAVLDDESFQAVQTVPPRGGLVQDLDTLFVNIPREHQMQSFAFNTAAERKPFDKPLKPFVNALKNLEKRKVPQARTETSNNCEAPRVTYRSVGSGPPGSTPNTN